MSVLNEMLQAQLLHTDESGLSAAKKGGAPKAEEEQYHKETVNVQCDCSPERTICMVGLLPALGTRINTDSASKRKAEEGRFVRKANAGQLPSTSTYYHPLIPLPSQIDRVDITTFDCNLHST